MAAIPRDLVATQAHCFYCDKSDTDTAQISPNFGIKFCVDHKVASTRDCHAYLHAHKGVSMYDAFNNPATKPFMDMVVDKGTFDIMLPSGELQGGWGLYVWPFEHHVIIRNILGVWLIPVLRSNNSGMREIPIIDFINCAGFPEEIVHQTLASLDAGIYLNDFNEVETVLGHQYPLDYVAQ
jgi:hypothetical protein